MRTALANILNIFSKKNGNIGRSASPRPLFLPAPRPFCLPRGMWPALGRPACVIFLTRPLARFWRLSTPRYHRNQRRRQMSILGQTALPSAAVGSRGTQKVVPDHFCAAPRPYVVRIDIDPWDYAPIGTIVKKGACLQFTSPTGPAVAPRVHFFENRRALSFLSARDTIEAGPARARPAVRYHGRTPSGLAPAA